MSTLTSLLVVGCAGAEDPCGADALRMPPSGGGANVVVILVDDIGIDKIDAYGPHAATPSTPTFDALSETGLRFEQAYTSPTCSPTRAGLLTGRRPARTTIGTWIGNESGSERSLPDDELTLPELLTGYHSALAGKWHLSALLDEPHLGALRQGFAHHWGPIANPTMAVRPVEGTLDWWRWQKSTDGELTIVERYLTEETTDDAIHFAQTLDEPFFLLVAYNGAHTPLHTPPAHLLDGPVGSEDADLLDAMITSVDHEVGRLLATLDPADTTVFVLADNGTHGDFMRPPYDPTHGKGTAFDEGVHVPMWAWGRGVSAVGRSTAALVHVTDLFATIADLAGVPTDTLERPIDGVSFAPLLTAPYTPWRRCVLSEGFTDGNDAASRRHRGVRDGRFELVQLPGQRAVLHDTHTPPDQRVDLLAERLEPEARAAHSVLRRALAKTP